MSNIVRGHEVNSLNQFGTLEPVGTSLQECIYDNLQRFSPLATLQSLLLEIGGVKPTSMFVLEEAAAVVDVKFTPQATFFKTGRLSISQWDAKTAVIIAEGRKQCAAEAMGCDQVYFGQWNDDEPTYAVVPQGSIAQFGVAFRLAINLAIKDLVAERALLINNNLAGYLQ